MKQEKLIHKSHTLNSPLIIIYAGMVKEELDTNY